MPGEIAVFPEHEANYHISMNRAECANDLIETVALVKEPETRKQTKAGN